jgi:hypothetical protein
MTPPTTADTPPPSRDLAAKLMPIAVASAYEDSVARWIDVLALHIAVIDAVKLHDTDEPAGVFRA